MTQAARRGLAVRYERCRHLVSYWARHRLIVENFAVRRRVAVTPVIVDILNRCDRPTTEAQLARAMRVKSPALLALLDDLVSAHVLRVAGSRPEPGDVAMDAWHGWNPAAGFFHSSTKDVPFESFDAGVRFFRKKLKRSRRPQPIKRTPGKLVSLPTPRVRGAFPTVLLDRRTWRAFGASPLKLGHVATLLNLTAGVQRWADGVADGRVALKTSPSGGARHPIETYLVALDVDRLEPGIYHYAADRHALVYLKPASRADVPAFVPKQEWYAAAGALVFFTAVVERTVWRYPYARAYRALQIEAGHVCQTFCLTATWLGLAPFCTLALGDSAIEASLGIDGCNETILYAAGVGSRPPGSTWAPSPDGAVPRWRPARIA